MLTKLLRATGVEPGEVGKVLWLTLNLALACGMLFLLRTITTVLFLDAYGASLLPWLFAAQAILFTALSLLHGSFIGRISRQAEAGGIQAILLAMLLIGRLALETDAHWVVFVLYVTLQAFTELLLIEATILQNASFHAREARRLQPLVNAGGTLGAIGGGVLAAFLPARIGTENALLVCMILVAAIFVSSRRVINHYAEPARSSEPDQAVFHRLSQSARSVADSRLMTLFVMLLFAGFLASTIIDFQLQSMLKQGYDKEGIATFLGLFHVAINSATLLVQLFINSHFLMLFGLVGGLVLMPLLVALGSMTFYFLPLLWVVTGTRFAEVLCSYSIFKDASNLLYMPFSPLEQGRLSIACRGIVKPLGVLAASGLLIVIGGSLDLRQLALVAVLFATISIVAALGMRKPYIEQLRLSLSNRRIRLQPMAFVGGRGNREMRQLLESTLSRADPAALPFALELVREQRIAISPGCLTAMLAQDSAEIRRDVLATIEALRMRKAVADLLLHLTPRAASDPDEVAACLRLIRLLAPHQGVKVASSFLQDPAWVVRGQALAALAATSDPAVLRRIRDELHGDAPRLVAAAALACGELKLRDVAARIGVLMANADPEVRAAATIAALTLQAPELVNDLIGQLRNPSLGRQSRDALVRQGTRVVAPLVQHWLQPDQIRALRNAIAAVLARIPAPESGLALLNLFAETDDFSRYRALAALNQQRRLREPTNAERGRARDALASELRRAYAERRLLGLVRGASDPLFVSAERRRHFDEEIGARLSRRRESVFRLLALIEAPAEIFRAWYNYGSANAKLRANSLELLDNILDAKTARPVLAFLEAADAAPAEGEADGRALEQALAACDAWLREIAAFALAPAIQSQGVVVMTNSSMATVERVFFLKTVPMFSALSAEALRPVAEVLEEVSKPDGSLIFSQGDVSDRLYLIVEGKVRVQRNNREIATLVRGASFGEMALLDNEPRSATLIAQGDCEFFCLDHQTFMEVLDEYPEVARGVMMVLSRRLRHTLGLGL